MAKNIKRPKVEKSKINRAKDNDVTGDLFENIDEKKLELTNVEVVNDVDNVKSLSDNKARSNKSRSTFNLSGDLYIEVHRSNVLQYFASGCIFPSEYSSQKAFIDPQSINESGLIISNGFISGDQDHVLIKIINSAIDPTYLSANKTFGLYNGIISISRIHKIFVNNIDTKKKTLDDAILRDSGFIPEPLIEVGYPQNLLKISYTDLNIKTNQWNPQLNKFDKILGLIAGSRNFNLLTYNRTGKYKSISDHTLFAVQAIDSNFAIDILDSGNLSDYYKWLFTNSCPEDRPLLRWLFNRVLENKNFTDADTDTFETICNQTNSFSNEENQVKAIFSVLRKSLERKKVLSDILTLQSKNSLALYVFAYLRIFGTSQNPELPRLELANSDVNKFSEYAFATLNFFFGYKLLRNAEDRINTAESTINEIVKVNFKPIIKFELNTEFDYRVIDLVFNLVFGLKSHDYSELSNIFREKDFSYKTVVGYDYFSTQLYGKNYLKIIKTSVINQVLPLLNKLPNEITIFSEFGLLCHRSGLKRNLISLEELIGNPKAIMKFVYYSKTDLINAINENKIDFEEIKLRIVLSQKHNEL
ncbi:hypothetical protein D3C87_02530 [compost metagenome]